ncbi:P-loop nucleoside triphosphate hydrolase superfamily protein [Medicago truncatula]|uniref:P-loop nucleoside triphosphate hydrolase superfamily protein n=2 Tax=Medicago truncatula TaxID=3880 RepID=G7KKE7_MEDTR|nr:P-loop nucleoside triphosphate hydrolase superfamily protein [Medicago truncatula]
MAMGIGEILSQLGSIAASLMFLYTLCPLNVQITFYESSDERLKQSETYTIIQTYLGANSSQRAKRLKAEVVEDSQSPLVLSMDDKEEIEDEFNGVKVWWSSNSKAPTRKASSGRPNFDVVRYLTLTFHKRHRDLITSSYIQHVLDQGKAVIFKNRRLKLYTNNSGCWWMSGWSHTNFAHPARFETLAMEPEKKEEIINDLVKFKKGKEYYAKVGKAWKRGYLLYGPPGTGKSTMISAIANFMNYDVYDLELTTVKDNNELKTLLIETSSKSVIVIEDIDCSLELTGQRKKKKEKDRNDKNENKEKTDKKSEEEDEDDDDDDEEEEEKRKSNVTLSGLLNSIDGIWSSCGGERIIIFTTNFVDKLDPALIRRGRMDKHIEMSYCRYQAFKVLAKNYLDVESHGDLFPIIEKLLGETNMSPADVAENLMPKSTTEDVEACLKNLIQYLEIAKEKEEEEAKKKGEKAQLVAGKDKQELAQDCRMNRWRRQVKNMRNFFGSC